MNPYKTLLDNNFTFGKIYLRQEINELFKVNKINNPTRFTYNRWNMGQSELNCFFEYLGNARYRYLGLDFDFTGPCFHHPKGSDNYKIGDWFNGNFTYADPTVFDIPSWKEKYKTTKKKLKNNI